ncbi:hypothetical protein BDW22DRAFT_1433286 [Trametopsis cervina]|nr:hypothetical protein BDW22DRAFT_1433286 [Trametopsis cervina]
MGEGRYTEDLVVIEVHIDMVTRRNFVGSAIDLGHSAAADFKKWIDRLLRCGCILSDDDMFNPDPGTKDEGRRTKDEGRRTSPALRPS